MTTTVFKSGNSICVRLPKGYELPVGRVVIEKDGSGITLKPEQNGYPEGFWDYFRDNGDPSWQRPEQPATPEAKRW